MSSFGIWAQFHATEKAPERGTVRIRCSMSESVWYFPEPGLSGQIAFPEHFAPEYRTDVEGEGNG